MDKVPEINSRMRVDVPDWLAYGVITVILAVVLVYVGGIISRRDRDKAKRRVNIGSPSPKRKSKKNKGRGTSYAIAAVAHE